MRRAERGLGQPEGSELGSRQDAGPDSESQRAVGEVIAFLVTTSPSEQCPHAFKLRVTQLLVT